MYLPLELSLNKDTRENIVNFGRKFSFRRYKSMIPRIDYYATTSIFKQFDHVNYHQGGDILSRHRFSTRSIKFSRNRLRGPIELQRTGFPSRMRGSVASVKFKWTRIDCTIRMHFLPNGDFFAVSATWRFCYDRPAPATLFWN